MRPVAQTSIPRACGVVDEVTQMNRVFRHSVSLAVLAASSPALAEEAAHAVASEGDSIVVTATRASR